MEVKLTDIALTRLHSQQLYGTTFKTAEQLVTWFAAVQGQEYALTKWGLGLRLPNLNNAAVEKELAEGNLLRTHLLRPTWHIVSARDIRWLLMLTAPRVNQANAFMYRKLELDQQIFNRCNDLLINMLEGSKQLSRDQVNEVFQKHNIEARGHRLSYLMMQAELAGIVCSGARQGNQFTYALLDERVAATTPLSNEEALAELSKRYFFSRGPATINDFATWSGLTLRDCRKGQEITRSLLADINYGGQTYYFHADNPPVKKPGQQIYLLPIYDELIMGYKDRGAILALMNSMDPKPGFAFDSMIMCDGQIIGTWRRAQTKKSMDISFDFFRPLTGRQQKAFKHAIHRFEEFTGLAVVNDDDFRPS